VWRIVSFAYTDRERYATGADLKWLRLTKTGEIGSSIRVKRVLYTGKKLGMGK